MISSITLFIIIFLPALILNHSKKNQAKKNYRERKSPFWLEFGTLDSFRKWYDSHVLYFACSVSCTDSRGPRIYIFCKTCLLQNSITFHPSNRFSIFWNKKKLQMWLFVKKKNSWLLLMFQCAWKHKSFFFVSDFHGYENSIGLYVFNFYWFLNNFTKQIQN